jgi:hypothetical protein
MKLFSIILTSFILLFTSCSKNESVKSTIASKLIGDWRVDSTVLYAKATPQPYIEGIYTIPLFIRFTADSMKYTGDSTFQGTMTRITYTDRDVIVAPNPIMNFNIRYTLYWTNGQKALIVTPQDSLTNRTQKNYMYYMTRL